jgi:hypothetical protein
MKVLTYIVAEFEEEFILEELRTQFEDNKQELEENGEEGDIGKGSGVTNQFVYEIRH